MASEQSSQKGGPDLSSETLSSQENDVQIYVYDLSRGLAKALSMSLIGNLSLMSTYIF